MQLISHRGCWSRPEEQNTLQAFARSFALGFGTEVDFRDSEGDLVVSHDPARSGAISALEFLTLRQGYDPRLPVAINIKADGLQSLVKAALIKAGVSSYFLFDMSIPDAVKSHKQGLRIYARHSDIETKPVLYSESAGVWMDAFFDHDWITAPQITAHLDAGKEVCLVSPELHGRSPLAFWALLRSTGLARREGLTLCTDRPEEARRFLLDD